MRFLIKNSISSQGSNGIYRITSIKRPLIEGAFILKNSKKWGGGGRLIEVKRIVK